MAGVDSTRNLKLCHLFFCCYFGILNYGIEKLKKITGIVVSCLFALYLPCKHTRQIITFVTILGETVFAADETAFANDKTGKPQDENISYLSPTTSPSGLVGVLYWEFFYSSICP